MRNSIVFIFLSVHIFISSLSLAQNSNNILNKTIDIDVKDQTIAVIIKEISKTAQINFSYSADLLNVNKVKSLVARNKSLNYILTELFSDVNIGFKIIGNQIVLFPISNSLQKYTINGYVREKTSRELLLGVNVYFPTLKMGTVTNNYGFYSITLPVMDSLVMVVSYVGYSPEIKKLNHNNTQEINFELAPKSELSEVTIYGKQQSRQSENVRMSTINIPMAQIKSVPSLLGEKDVLKVIQLMPGVKKGGEGTSGFYVRGGSPDQNLIMLDDALVYNASHLFGFFSLFNGDALKSVELTKGGFPARFGGRLSSVLELNMKDGNKQEWHGEAGIGLISSRFMIEGPLKRDKSSIIISGRRTYADLFALPFQKENRFGYYFYDLNAKINYEVNPQNKLYVSGYFGRDIFYHRYNNSYKSEKNEFFWGNATGTLRWNHLYNSKLFSNLSIIYSKYKFQIAAKSNNTNGINNYTAEYHSGIQDLSFKMDWDYFPHHRHWIKAGMFNTWHRYRPHAIVHVNTNENIDSTNIKTINSFENAFYIEDSYSPTQFLKFNGGIRFSSLLVGQSTYWKLEPRISAAVKLHKDIAFKASYAEMNQYIHLLSNTGIGLPTDLWLPATEKVKPQSSKQWATGICWDLPFKDLSFSVEGYYKKMNNIITYKNGASFIDIASDDIVGHSNWENKVTSGKGRSYGLEFLLQRKIGKFSGWIGYTLSWTKHRFDSVNNGIEYFARYDRRHDISIVGIYKISPKITLSASWVYGTGNAITLPTSKFIVYPHKNPPYYSDHIHEDIWSAQTFSSKNAFRMEPHHRLDLGIQFHKKKKWGERTWEISCYNAYNRANPFFYSPNTRFLGFGGNYNNKNSIKKVSLYPIIPSITYSIKF